MVHVSLYATNSVNASFGLMICYDKLNWVYFMLQQDVFSFLTGVDKIVVFRLVGFPYKKAPQK